MNSQDLANWLVSVCYGKVREGKALARKRQEQAAQECKERIDVFMRTALEETK